MQCKKTPAGSDRWTTAQGGVISAAYIMDTPSPSIDDPFAQELEIWTDGLAPFPRPAEVSAEVLQPRLCANDARLTASGGDFGFIEEEESEELDA